MIYRLKFKDLQADLFLFDCFLGARRLFATNSTFHEAHESGNCENHFTVNSTLIALFLFPRWLQMI
jgi:hypothetical protein